MSEQLIAWTTTALKWFLLFFFFKLGLTKTEANFSIFQKPKKEVSNIYNLFIVQQQHADAVELCI